MSFSEKLKSVLNDKNIKAAELSRLTGISEAAISDYLKGKKEPRGKQSVAISKALNISLDVLWETEFTNVMHAYSYTDEEKAHLNNYRLLDTYGKEAVDNLLSIELKRIQQEAETINRGTDLDSVLTYDLPASAGTGMFLDSESCEHIDYPADEVPTGTDFAVRISGDSMVPDYPDGSTAFIRKQQVKEGEIGVFVLNGESYIKQLKRKGDDMCLVSLNPKYKDIKLLDTDSIYCVGKVLN